MKPPDPGVLGRLKFTIFHILAHLNEAQNGR